MIGGRPGASKVYVVLPLLAERALLDRSAGGASLAIANPIYREAIPRSLAGAALASLPQLQPTWLDADGVLDEGRLLAAFLDFWRQHGEPLLASAPYHEVAPHLVLMAFLHRVVNGGGTIEREYAIGSGRMDRRARARSRLAGDLRSPRRRAPLRARSRRRRGGG